MRLTPSSSFWLPSAATVATAAATLTAVVVALAACGGPGAHNPQGSQGDAGIEAGSSPAQIISTLPKDVRSPPPFHLGSKRAAVRAHEDWAACHMTFHPIAPGGAGAGAGVDVGKAVEALATACASATKTHSAAATMTGTQSAISSMPVIYKFHAQANHCYRVYAVASANVKSLVAVVTDSDGAQIAEYHTDDVTPFIAPDEALCFSANDDPKISVSVGLGDGPYALAVWQD